MSEVQRNLWDAAITVTSWKPSKSWIRKVRMPSEYIGKLMYSLVDDLTKQRYFVNGEDADLAALSEWLNRHGVEDASEWIEENLPGMVQKLTAKAFRRMK